MKSNTTVTLEPDDESREALNDAVKALKEAFTNLDQLVEQWVASLRIRKGE